MIVKRACIYSLYHIDEARGVALTLVSVGGDRGSIVLEAMQYHPLVRLRLGDNLLV